jgi:hypothetical protein
MSAGGQTGAGSASVARLGGFSALVWIAGLVVAGLIGLGYVGDDAFDVGPIGVDEDYARSPWTSGSPIAADDLGGGRYEGVDGAVIRLTGVDPDQPIVVTPEESSYVGSVRVTGPDGVIVTEGEYDEPPRFSSAADGRIIVLVEQSDVELWIDGFTDEAWRAQVAFDGVDRTEGVASGFDSAVFLHEGGASTARLSARGEGYLAVTVTTPHGSETVLDGEAPLDQSIAWRDATAVVFSVETGNDAGWRLEFSPEPGSPAPKATP